MSKVDGRGRPSYSKLEKAISQSVKHTETLQGMEKEFNVTVGFGSDEERNEDLQEVVDARKDIAEQKDEVSKKIREFSAAGDIANKEKYEALRKELDKELRTMPPLGFTFEEWGDQEAEAEAADRGRPTLEIEVKLVRAERAMNEAKALAANLLKEEGRDPSELDALIESQLNKEVKPGRPKSDELGQLDKRLVDVQRKIEYVESGQAKKDREDKAVYSDSGKLKGRKPKPLDELLLDYQSEAESIAERIELLESKLDKVGKLNRQLKLLRDEKRALKKVINSDGNMTAKQISNHPEMAPILSKEIELQDMISEANGIPVTRRAKVSKKVGPKAQKIANAKKEELQKSSNEIDAQAEEMSEEDSIIKMLNSASEDNQVANG